MVAKQPGGNPFSFVDIEKHDTMQARNWNPSAPVWRQVIDGMSIEGKYNNFSCVPFNKMVIFKKGFGDFDLLKIKSICPLCMNEFKPIKP
jgi:hypothetical protein